MKTIVTLRVIAILLMLTSIMLFIVAANSRTETETVTFEEAPVGELISHGVNTGMQRTIDGRELQGE